MSEQEKAESRGKLKPSFERKGFSIVELLVVIAIICLLLALLLPTLTRVREYTKRAVCTNNLRQIGLGMLAYTSDFIGWYPPTRGPSDDDMRILYPDYVEELDVFICPGTKNYVESRNDLRNNASRGTSARGMSYEYQAWDQRGLIPLTVDWPCTAVIVADQDDAGINCRIGPTDNHGVWGGNMLYVDGTVNWFRGDKWYDWGGEPFR